MLKRNYIVSNKQIKQTKQGKDYISLLLTSDDNEKIAVDGKIWSEHFEKLKSKFNNGDIIKVTEGKEDNYNNNRQLNIFDLLVVEQKKWGLTPEEARKVYNNILEFIDNNIFNKNIKDITLNTLSKYASNSFFFQAPAAKTYHHSFPGGLLQHTWEVCNIALAIKETQFFPTIDWDMAFSACVMHDLGKMNDYSLKDGVIDKTNLISLTGHLVTTPLEIFDSAKTLGLHETPMFHNLLHAVVAHHGKKEFGSPQTPVTREAWVVHLADMISSQIIEPA